MLSTTVGIALADPSAVKATEATGFAALGWLMIALPLLGAAVLLIGGKATNRFGPGLAVGLSWASFGVGLGVIFQLAGMAEDERSLSVQLWDWVSAGELNVNIGLLLDPLSLTFVMLITFVGSLIHVYSLGYMEHDADKRRFFGYLNLFIAAMLTLVLADSYLLLFVGWEGVGLASYLLIGFWNHKPEFATAANKAFVVNRIGDVGLITAMAVLFANLGSLNFITVFGEADTLGQGTLLAVGLLLLLAACGKSAQFPLQSWLGDAMAGPTPVSALIHAATMVTAGVYLIARSQAIYDLTPDARVFVASVGAITLVYGAIVGCAKDDLKKALAASTMSQIGYMMLAVGLGPIGYVFAIFHLLTHGFFKAGMFLGAGSVMHGMNDRVNMRRFGGLNTVMKVTWITFMMGWLAILGVPPFAGFWSKDKIIEVAFVGEGWQPWVFGTTALVGAGITSFYMSRLFFMTFQGEARWEDDQHPHESPLSMTVPMMILAVGSVTLGLILGPTGWLEHWLEPVFGHEEHEEPVIAIWLIITLTLLLVAAGAALAYKMYWRDTVPKTAPEGTLVTQAARRDLFQDDFNELFLRKPGQGLVDITSAADRDVVDGGMVDKTTGGVAGLSAALRRTQTGFARSYAMTMLVGTVLVVLAVLVMQ